MKLHRFPKSERLSSRKIIEKLFNPALQQNIGGNVFLYPFKIVWTNQVEIPQENPHTLSMPQVLFSVSKRNCKRANTRNRIRRQLKEIYRTNKNRLFSDATFPPAFCIIYVAKEENEFVFLQKKLLIVLDKMLKAYKS